MGNVPPLCPLLEAFLQEMLEALAGDLAGESSPLLACQRMTYCPGPSLSLSGARKFLRITLLVPQAANSEGKHLRLNLPPLDGFLSHGLS